MSKACVTLGMSPSFGFGDRIGSATPGHVAAMKRCGAGIAPIFAQQSIREMARTGRTAQQVMQDALGLSASCGWEGAMGADADHLKTSDDVNVTAEAGFTFFTIDPSDEVDQQADDYDESTVRQRFEGVREHAPWYDRHLGTSMTLRTGTVIDLDESACMRAAIKYGPAIKKAIALSKHVQSVQENAGRDYEIELSVDETEQPTTLAEHYIIASECLSAGMKLVSLAPRFIGDFEKGVDFKGDLRLLEKSLRDHAALARVLGPYKLSLHSGSDKLSMYAMLARATGGMFHVKTAGTSYLEALRVVARHQPDAFRAIIDFARSRYETDRATYHVSATLADAPQAAEAAIELLEAEYIECWSHVPRGRGFTKPGRQIMHCTFGSVLTHEEFGPLVKGCMSDYPDTYRQVLEDHFGRHLQSLQDGMTSLATRGKR